MEVDQMAAIASSSTHPWSNVCKACIVTYHDNPTVSTHLFLPFWRKLRCGRSLLRSGPGQVAHCRSKRRHRRAWDRIAAMARWPVGHAVLYKSLPPHPSLCETWWPSCYPSASLWVITVITIGKICKCKLIFSSPMFTNVHQCSPSLWIFSSRVHGMASNRLPILISSHSSLLMTSEAVWGCQSCQIHSNSDSHPLWANLPFICSSPKFLCRLRFSVISFRTSEPHLEIGEKVHSYLLDTRIR